MTRSKSYAAGVCAAIAFGAGLTAAAAERADFWSLGQTMRRLDGMRIRIGGRPVRLDAPTLLCSGVGRSFRQNGVRRWHRFHCTYVAFVHGETYDCDFRVLVVDRRHLSVRDPRWVGGAP
jgi:hypothetical protein